MSNARIDRDLLTDLKLTGEAVTRLLERDAFDDVVRAFWSDDAAAFAETLERFGTLRRCSLICGYLCTYRCGLLCLRLAGPPPELDAEPKFEELLEVSARIAELDPDEVLEPLARAVDGEDEATFKQLVERHQLHELQHWLCRWICSIRCRLYCRLVCEPTFAASDDLVAAVRAEREAVARLVEQPEAFQELFKAVENDDDERFQKVIEELGLFQHCRLICAYVCGWICYRVCLFLCREFPLAAPNDPIEATIGFGKITAVLARREGALEKLAAAVAKRDVDAFSALIEDLQLHRHCHWVCFWICAFRCRLLCWLICPPACDLSEPDGCVDERSFPDLDIFRGIEIRGTAGGAFCDHYTLEWREAGTVAWRSDGIRYPGGAAQGSCGVVNGLLGYLETFPAVPEGPVEIRLCIFSSQPNTPPSCCTTTFDLQRKAVWISGIEGLQPETPPGVLDPNAQLVDGSNDVRSFGNVLRVFGSAWVGGCPGRELRRYTLAFHPGFVTDPTLPGFVQFWQVDFDQNAFQDAYRNNNPVFETALTSVWRRLQICFPGCFTINHYLQASRWNTEQPAVHFVEAVDPPAVPNPPSWSSTPIPLPNCRSGRYTLRLTVEDESGIVDHDLQQVWIDNKKIGESHAKISQIAGVDPCAVTHLSEFAIDNGVCAVPWPADLLGIAYDELIEEGNSAAPSDNFGGYRLWVKKNGAPGLGVPLPVPNPGGPLIGTSRVGTPDPADRCPNPVPPAGALPPETDGILTTVDMRQFDGFCSGGGPLTLARGVGGQPGECCNYVFTLQVWDRSICPGLSNSRHERFHSFPMRICNDLPPAP